MKKSLFTLLCGGALLFGASNLYAQCTPNPDACQPANPNLPACIAPDVADSGFVDMAYAGQAINILIGQKTPGPGGLDVFIRRVEIVKVNKIPAGLTLTINTANTSDPGGGTITINADGTPNPGGMIRPPNNNNKGTYICGKLTGTPTTVTAVLDSMEIVANIFVSLATNSGDGTDANQFAPGTNPVKFNYKVPIGMFTGVSEKMDISSILKFEMFPNPGVGATKLNYNLSENSDVSVRVTSIEGKEIYASQIGRQNAGKQTFELPALPQGFYFVTLQIGEYQITKKLIRN